jgi:hypothetical protein
MRKIKFRAWDGKEFYNPILSEGLMFRSFRDFEDFDDADDVLMQYTGLKDSNGNEIFEGDIVRYKQRNLEAAFGMAEGDDYIEKTREIKFTDQSFNVPAGFIKDLEVIGNIYEGNEN